MRRASTALCLAFLAATFIACGVRVNSPATLPGATTTPGGPAAAPVVLSAQQLAQEFHDEWLGVNKRSATGLLQVTGTVSALELPSSFKEPGPDDITGGIVFKVPVTDKKTSATKEYVITCLLNPPVSPEQRKAAGLEKGKPITIRGTVLARQDLQASLQNCTLVTDGGR